MRLIAWIQQRIADYQRERRIRALVRFICADMAAGRLDLARRNWDCLRAEIEARSPQQIARMDQNLLRDLDPQLRRRFYDEVATSKAESERRAP